MKKLALAFILATISFSASALTPPDSTNTIFEKGTAAYIIGEGKNLYNEGAYTLALAKFRNALEKDKNNAQATYWIAECHLALRNYEKAIDNGEKARELDKEVSNELAYLLGVAYHRTGNLDKSIENFQMLKTSLSQTRYKELDVDFRIAEVERAKTMMATPIKVNITALGMHVNSPQDEYALVYSSNRRAMYFTSRRSDTNGGGVSSGDSRYFSDIYVCLWDTVNNKWGEASNDLDINRRLNSYGFDGVAHITMDGGMMLLTINTMGLKSPKPKTRHTDIFYSKFSTKGTWTKPKPMPKPINSVFFDAAPCFNGDETAIYFISERPGGMGMADIYVCEKEGKEWGKAKNLEILNTKGQETTVYVTPDESMIFFSSTGHEGMGGYDIYVSKNVDGEWTAPKNLGYPINTVSDETHFRYYEDLGKAYYSTFSTPDNGGKGRRDIFEIGLKDYTWPE
ncbi:MAG: tetratricopeptide repeat protein [Crocinitomicaceae bacterium]|nr:tetratricopeptide repeat protein [Crocinitomicaceae bacterium]